MENAALISSVRSVDVMRYLHEEFGLTTEDARAQNGMALYNAACNGRLDAVKYLKEGFGLTVDDARVQSNLALRCSARNGHLEVVKYLMEGFGLTAEDVREANGHQYCYHPGVERYLKVVILKDPAACLLHGIRSRLKDQQ